MDDGMAVEVARRAADSGVRTEIVGVAPTDDAGDRLLIELSEAGVGHATVTRSAAGGIEAADLELALRYLPDVRAIILVRPGASLLAPALAAGSWSGAPLVIVGPLDPEGVAILDAAPSSPTVLEPPADDREGSFAGLLVALALRLEAGEDFAHAWRATMKPLSVDRFR
jgi:hypothetical protein